jgi:hypothetical protein
MSPLRNEYDKAYLSLPMTPYVLVAVYKQAEKFLAYPTADMKLRISGL